MLETQVTLNHAAGTAASTVTSWIPLDPHLHPFSVSFFVVPATTGGSFAFSVQHTPDNVLETGVTPTAFDHSTVSAKTAKIDGNYAFPVRAVRLISLSASSTDPRYTFYVKQAGI